ncbi:hypothetical protein ABXS71_03005 [Bacillus infantis]|uniref:hypothetical protein n=1 Tax=Bacillus infantis TaxID=324767 RepID=UPI00344D4CF5
MNLKKLILVVLLVLSIGFLLGCGIKEQSRYFKVSTEVSKISLSGRGLQKLFSTSDAGLLSVEVVDPKDVSTFIEILENAEFSSGPKTRKEPNLQVTLFFEDTSHMVFDFWLNPYRKTARFTNESGETFIFNKKEVLSLVEFLSISR